MLFRSGRKLLKTRQSIWPVFGVGLAQADDTLLTIKAVDEDDTTPYSSATLTLRRHERMESDGEIQVPISDVIRIASGGNHAIMATESALLRLDPKDPVQTTLRLIDLSQKRVSGKREVTGGAVTGLEMVDSGRTGAIAFEDGTLQFGEVASTDEWPSHRTAGKIVALTTHETTLRLGVLCEDRWVQVWDIKSKQVTKQLRLAKEGRSISFSPSGNQLAVGHRDGSISVHSLR